MPKHKAWIKPKVIIIDIGKCKYCHKNMTNQESFVTFYPRGKAHYVCMKKSDEDKTYENESKFDW